MTAWILELFDEWNACPVLVGVYSTPERAEAAYDILVRQLEARGELMEERYDMSIEPIQIDSFIDVALTWIGAC